MKPTWAGNLWIWTEKMPLPVFPPWRDVADFFYFLPFSPRELMESRSWAPQGQPQPALSFPRERDFGRQCLAIFPSIASLLLPTSRKWRDMLILPGVSLPLYYGRIATRRCPKGNERASLSLGECRYAYKGVCSIVWCCSQHACVSNQRQWSTWRISPFTRRVTAQVRICGKSLCVREKDGDVGSVKEQNG